MFSGLRNLNKGGAADEMGIWHDHGAGDFAVCSEREHDGDVKHSDSGLDSTEHLFYAREKNKCSVLLAVRKE